MDGKYSNATHIVCLNKRAEVHFIHTERLHQEVIETATYSTKKSRCKSVSDSRGLSYVGLLPHDNTVIYTFVKHIRGGSV